MNTEAPQFFGKNLLTVETLARYARSDQNWRDLLRFHQSLATDPYVAYVDSFYRRGRELYGENWDYLDLVTVLHAAAKLIQPTQYLEIGVRRGRTVCTVAQAAPKVAIVGCDMWIPGYANMDNPGPEFVQQELTRSSHCGELHFINGNSHEVLPELFRNNPNARFDLITVDGDHTAEGALADLKTVIPHLSTGGVLVFDDISHPQHPYLLDVWREATSVHENLQCYEYGALGYGVAFAICREAQ